MDWQKLKKELWDITKGAIAAALTSAVIALLQYLGTHIPEVIQYITQTGAAVAVIKKIRV